MNKQVQVLKVLRGAIEYHAKHGRVAQEALAKDSKPSTAVQQGYLARALAMGAIILQFPPDEAADFIRNLNVFIDKLEEMP